MFYLSLAMTVAGTLVYHIAQKSTPRDVNPFLALAVSFGTAAAVCLLLMAASPGRADALASVGRLNWASFALAFSIVAVEVGFLFAYRAGWRLSVASVTSNVAVALLILPVAVLAFREHILPRNLLGIAFCIAGLILLMRD